MIIANRLGTFTNGLSRSKLWCAMKIRDTFLNRSEELVFRELEDIASDNNLRAFPKPRLSDVLQKDEYLSEREFEFYTRSHCDFLVTDHSYRPHMIIEYDGPYHADAKQQVRDRIKNDLCKRAGLGVLRIHDGHVAEYNGGMTLLRWIMEVSELEKAFNEAQANGQIPYDEGFDPTFLHGLGDGNLFPYWLSDQATQSFHEFFSTLDPDMPKGWAGILGHDNEETAHRLSYLRFGDNVLWGVSAVRKQDLSFPHYELINEIGTYKLGSRLKKFRKGEIAASSKEEFNQMVETFSERYNARPSRSVGNFPLEWI